jgi:hypothetical protein
MLRRPMRRALLLALLAGCGSRTPPPRAERPRPGALPPLPVVHGPPDPWDDMAYGARKDYMIRSIRPVMAKLFRGYDPLRFADFGCHTCHGPDANERHHEMPNQLPPLWPTGSPEQQQTVALHPEIARFMFNRVRPTMRDLLGLDDFDPETGTGFGCFNCHPHGDTPARASPEPASPAEPEPSTTGAPAP